MTPRALHRFALFTAALTFCLLGAGGLVTSHGVGMAVPDWPNTFGYNMFFFPFSQWVGGVFYEHSHRLIASAVGLCATILAIWLYGHKAQAFLRWFGVALLALAVCTLGVRPGRWPDALVAGVTAAAALAASFGWPRSQPAPRWLRRLGMVGFVAVVLQGVLGGLRVVLFKDQIGIFHATLAQVYFALACALALFTSRWWERTFGSPWNARAETTVPDRELTLSEPSPQLAWLAVAATGLILAQLVLGATMRHQHAGLSIPDFPSAYGKLWPAMDPQSVALYNQHRVEVVDLNPITAAQIGLQMAHRLMALGILMLIATTARVARREGSNAPARTLTLTWLGLVIVQALLGAATIWSNKAADIATAHVLLGALSLTFGTTLCIVLRQQIKFASRCSPAVLPTNCPQSAPFGAPPAPA